LDAAEPEVVGAVYADMEAAARDMLRAAKVPESQWALERGADLRYTRQAYELNVAAQPGPITGATLRDLANQFHEKHRNTYGHANPDEAIQLVKLRLTAIGKLEGLDLRQDSASLVEGYKGSRSVWFKVTGRTDCAIFDREGIGVGDRIAGPAVIEAVDTTIIVPPGWTVKSDEKGHILMEMCDGE
jgi:N-methylhydantoinase A